MTYNHPDSDIDTTPVEFDVRCRTCGKVERVETIAEERGHFQQNEDGTYSTACGECFDCLAGATTMPDDQPEWLEMIRTRPAEVLLIWMAENGSSVSLDWGEDTDAWECSWIVGGKRFTSQAETPHSALRQAVRQVFAGRT